MSDRVVVVAGATGLLGPVVARAFAESGSRIGALSRSQDELDAVIATLPGGNDRHIGVACELSKPESVASARQTVIASLGAPAVLLQLVGGYIGELPIAEAPLDEWPAMLERNLWPTLHAVRAFLPEIRAAEHGRLVTVSTPFAQNPGAGATAYAASKAAVEALTLSVAKDLSGTTATANVVLIRTIGSAKPTHTHAEEIAAAMLWLCTPHAGAINGQRIPLIGRA